MSSHIRKRVALPLHEDVPSPIFDVEGFTLETPSHLLAGDMSYSPSTWAWAKENTLIRSRIARTCNFRSTNDVDIDRSMVEDRPHWSLDRPLGPYTHTNMTPHRVCGFFISSGSIRTTAGPLMLIGGVTFSKIKITLVTLHAIKELPPAFWPQVDNSGGRRSVRRGGASKLTLANDFISFFSWDDDSSARKEKDRDSLLRYSIPMDPDSSYSY